MSDAKSQEADLSGISRSEMMSALFAQLVIQRVEKARFVEVETLPGSARSDGGHGSTGGFSGVTR